MLPRGAAVFFLALFAVVLASRSPVYDYNRAKLTDVGGVQRAYNETHAMYLGRLVSVAYCAKEHVEAWTCAPCGYVAKLPNLIVINDKKQYFQGILGYTGTHILVAFRGSMDIRNWIDNLSFVKTHPWPNMPKAAVHQGFYWVYESIQEQLVLAIQALRALYPNAPVIVTGHSLGAAVTAIAVLDLHAKHNITAEQMLTFGEPRVGNAAFVSRLHQVVPHIHRVTHWRDIVPHVPLEWQGFVHEAQEIWYNEDSSVYKECDPNNGEDSHCCKQFPTVTSFADHVVYLNITMSHLLC